MHLVQLSIQWLPKIPGDILSVWIETFSLVELAESGVNTSVKMPFPVHDCHGELHMGKSEANGIFHTEPFSTRRMKGSISRTVWPFQ
jgi:hypothetical protein